MCKKVFAVMAVLMIILGTVGAICCEGFPPRQEEPLYVVADYAIEGGWGDEDGENPYCFYYPKGAFIYNWQEGDDDGEYVVINWVGDSSVIHEKFLSRTPPAVKAPVVVDHCDEWVSLRKKPSASSERIAKLDLYTRIDDWTIYNSDFLFVRVDGKEGYVSLDYIAQAVFSDFNNPESNLTVGNCEEWVSLRE